MTQRQQEFIQALEKAVEESLGDRVKDMLEVQSVMTRAEMRGKGYASSLIRKLTDEVRFGCVYVYRFRYSAVAYASGGPTTSCILADQRLHCGEHKIL